MIEHDSPKRALLNRHGTDNCTVYSGWTAHCRALHCWLQQQYLCLRPDWGWKDTHHARFLDRSWAGETRGQSALPSCCPPTTTCLITAFMGSCYSLDNMMPRLQRLQLETSSLSTCSTKKSGTVLVIWWIIRDFFNMCSVVSHCGFLNGYSSASQKRSPQQ